MKNTTCLTLAASLIATALLASCAAPMQAERAATAEAMPGVAAESTKSIDAETPPATASASGAAFATNHASPTAVPGADPGVVDNGIDPYASPEGFSALKPVLEQRAESRWNLLIDGKGEQAYEFLSAGVRSSLDREVYANDMRSRPLLWLAADALDGQCEGGTCLVRVLVKVKFKIQAGGGRDMETDSVVTERWIEVDGVWAHIPDEYVQGFTK